MPGGSVIKIRRDVVVDHEPVAAQVPLRTNASARGSTKLGSGEIARESERNLSSAVHTPRKVR